MAMTNDVPAFCEASANFDYVTDDALAKLAYFRGVFGYRRVRLTVRCLFYMY